MRWPAVIALSLAAAAPAAAHPARPRPAAPPADLWRELLAPHAAEVEALLDHARQALRVLESEAQPTDSEWAVEARLGYLHDVRGLMRHARALSPAHPEVLALLGLAADELGDAREAEEALAAHVRARGEERASAAVRARLGALLLRKGEVDAGLRQLRAAHGPLRPDTAPALVHLASALAARGDVAGAEAALRGVLPAHPPAYLSQEQTLVMFALAVLYDRDEQRSAALEVLDQLRGVLQDAYVPQVRTALAGLRFTPPEDQHYFLALLYESARADAEARAAWALYAASGAPPWRARALDHVRALDHLRGGWLGRPPAGAAARPRSSPPAPIRRRVTP